ncbi:MAG: ABC transporter permease [Anaerolineales bacterium]
MPFDGLRTKVAYRIAAKDVRIYFLKGPNLTFGILLPLVLYWAFAIDRRLDLAVVIPGLIAMAILFGAGAIQGVSLPLERRTGTLNTLLAAPSTLFTVMLGKAWAGMLFGVLLSLVYFVAVIVLTPLRMNLLLFVTACLVASFCFSCFGLFLAAPFQDIPQAMPPATVIRIAMVFSASTFTPVETMSTSRRAIAQLMPLTYAVDALRQAGRSPTNLGLYARDLAILALLGTAFLIIATALVQKSFD